MKVIILALFASFAVGAVFGDEKSDAIKEINTKYNDLFTYAHTVVKNIEKEMAKTDQTKVEETIKYVKELKNTILAEFADEVKKVSRTAIVKGKPLSTFDCLAKASVEGRDQILTTHEEFVDKVNGVAGERSSRLELSLISAGLILNAVTELKDQAIQRIEEAKSGIKPLKEDALKRIDNGKKQFKYLESSIQKPTLEEEYIALKTNTETKFTEIKEALYRRLQKCLL